MRGSGTVLRAVRGVLAGAALVALATAAGAQDKPADGSEAAKTGAGSHGNIVGAGSGNGGTAPGVTIDPSAGGVAGTGMGKMPPAGNAPGTGQSVKGPPGQDLKMEDTGQKP